MLSEKPLLPSALGGGLGRPRRSGIPSPEGERRMSNSYLKVLHFDLESSRCKVTKLCGKQKAFGACLFGKKIIAVR